MKLIHGDCLAEMDKPLQKVSRLMQSLLAPLRNYCLVGPIIPFDAMGKAK